MMDRDELLEELDRRLSREAMASVRRELERCEVTGEEFWLEKVLRASQTLPMPTVPPMVSQDLRDLFRNDVLISRHPAVMIYDSRTAELTGVRGADTLEGWSLTYTSEVADIALDVWPQHASLDIDGQVLSHGGELLVWRAEVRSTETGEVTSSADGDHLGCFSLRGVAPGAHELALRNRRHELVLRIDLPMSS